MRIVYNKPAGYIRRFTPEDLKSLEAPIEFFAGVELNVDDALGEEILERFPDFNRIDDESLSDARIDAETPNSVPQSGVTRQSSDSASGEHSSVGTDTDAGS